MNDISHQQNLPKRASTLRILGILVSLTILIVLVIWLRVMYAGDGSRARLATFVVKEGPLNISIIESSQVRLVGIYTRVTFKTTVWQWIESRSLK